MARSALARDEGCAEGPKPTWVRAGGGMTLGSRSGNCEAVTLPPFEDVGVGGDALPSLDFAAPISGLAAVCGCVCVGRACGLVDGATFGVATSRRFVIATMARVDRRDCLRAMRNSIIAVAKLLLIVGRKW